MLWDDFPWSRNNESLPTPWPWALNPLVTQNIRKRKSHVLSCMRILKPSFEERKEKDGWDVVCSGGRGGGGDPRVRRRRARSPGRLSEGRLPPGQDRRPLPQQIPCHQETGMGAFFNGLCSLLIVGRDVNPASN